jgi:uncharacterized protein YacL
MIGVGLLGASFLTLTVSHEQTDSLRRALSAPLAERYERIVHERTTHYLQGLSIGLVLAFLILGSSGASNIYHRITLFSAVTLFVCALYYMLVPKSDYMIKHLSSRSENEAWLKVYKTMKYRYLLGFVLGALAAVPLGMAMC